MSEIRGKNKLGSTKNFASSYRKIPIKKILMLNRYTEKSIKFVTFQTAQACSVSWLKLICHFHDHLNILHAIARVVG